MNSSEMMKKIEEVCKQCGIQFEWVKAGANPNPPKKPNRFRERSKIPPYAVSHLLSLFFPS
jgi:hypothetical protein